MKKVISLVTIFILLASFCFHRFIVSVEDQDQKFKLFVKTERKQNTMCKLVIDNLEIISPENDIDGYLVLDLIKDPEGVCLMAYGPQKGTFYFEKQTQVPYGSYHLIINKEDYGILRVLENKVILN